MSFKTKNIDSSLPTGTLVKGSDNRIYVISAKNRYWIQSAKIFNELGLQWSWVKKVSDNTLMDYKKIGNITDSRKHPDGMLIKYEGNPTVYLMENGQKRPILSKKAFDKNGFNWARIILIKAKNANQFNYATGANIQ